MLDHQLIAYYEALYERAMAYPEAHEDQPWGHPAIKVRKKVFLFLSNLDQEHISGSVKLPDSAADALGLGFTEPTGYGLGKSGWVSFKITEPAQISLETLLLWLDESYRVVAPKKLVKQLDADKLVVSMGGPGHSFTATVTLASGTCVADQGRPAKSGTAPERRTVEFVLGDDELTTLRTTATELHARGNYEHREQFAMAGVSYHVTLGGVEVVADYHVEGQVPEYPRVYDLIADRIHAIEW